MARRTPSWVLQRRAQEAAAREAYYSSRNSSDDTFNATVESRPRMRVGYRSLNMKIGAPPDHAKLSVRASERAIKWFEGIAATGTLAAGNTRLGLEYVDLSEFLPIDKFTTSKLHATLGATNPTAVRTAWGTRYIKYSATGAGTGDSAYSAPLSDKTGAFTAADLASAAQLIADLGAIRTALRENGRMWFEPEEEPYILATG